MFPHTYFNLRDKAREEVEKMERKERERPKPPPLALKPTVQYFKASSPLEAFPSLTIFNDPESTTTQIVYGCVDKNTYLRYTNSTFPATFEESGLVVPPPCSLAEERELTMKTLLAKIEYQKLKLQHVNTRDALMTVHRGNANDFVESISMEIKTSCMKRRLPLTLTFIGCKLTSDPRKDLAFLGCTIQVKLDSVAFAAGAPAEEMPVLTFERLEGPCIKALKDLGFTNDEELKLCPSGTLLECGVSQELFSNEVQWEAAIQSMKVFNDLPETKIMQKCQEQDSIVKIEEQEENEFPSHFLLRYRQAINKSDIAPSTYNEILWVLWARERTPFLEFLFQWYGDTFDEVSLELVANGFNSEEKLGFMHPNDLPKSTRPELKKQLNMHRKETFKSMLDSSDFEAHLFESQKDILNDLSITTLEELTNIFTSPLPYISQQGTFEFDFMTRCTYLHWLRQVQSSASECKLLLDQELYSKRDILLYDGQPDVLPELQRFIERIKKVSD